MEEAQTGVHQEIFNHIQDSIEERLLPMEEGMSETRETIDKMYQMISGSSNSGQGQNQNRFGNNKNGGNFQRQDNFKEVMVKIRVKDKEGMVKTGKMDKIRVMVLVMSQNLLGLCCLM